ncbi:MAG: squalene/phytoene synthase family protein [Bacteroidales bacterium]|nr:squalene/phytoene synthase family protein [Bacteroidales bacterium]
MKSHQEEFLKIFSTIDFRNIIDHPNILIAARFWEKERYCAAEICYKFMRMIDDMIDNHKAKNILIKETEKESFLKNVNQWLQKTVVSEECNPEHNKLIDTIKKFVIPLWPLEYFAKSMIYDINNDSFPTFESFFDYSMGASVAPASVFVHLCGIRKTGNGYAEPSFDVKKAATPCAIFSYLVHIIRDFQKDQLNNLNYFADDLIAENNLTRKDLRNIALGSQPTDNFRNLISAYFNHADHYRLKTMDTIKEIKHLMEPRYQLSLEIIFSLYLMVFERINIRNGRFTSAELNPTPEETAGRVYETILNFSAE